ncbi:GspE/PulE family protein, partial [Planctomycetota bacterium]
CTWRQRLRQLLTRVYSKQTPLVNSEADTESCETVEACDDLLRAAMLRGASDIHLMPGESTLRTKLRVDGVLEDYREFPATLQSGLVSRIKVLAGMNIAEKREPQDGRFTAEHACHRKPIDIRVATIPTRHGERVTLRLLSPMEGTPSLEDLGMDEKELATFTKAIASSNGLVLLTGPTGCGKSTTLYTAITHLLETRGGNVITVEDPIEYEIPGASQVEVDSLEKVSFSRALRSILRHDPDVIMLGEIRDAETAELAIKASLTGHLVFSTLHTNTAAGVVTRLVDMGVEPFLITATLRLAVAQRLVRRLCPHCRVRVKLGSMDAAALGAPQLMGREAFEPKGCVYCAGKGFAGRSALFEMLPGGGAVADAITRGSAETELLDHMRQAGHSMLIDDGIKKTLAGTTTAQQVLAAVATW